MRYKIVFQSDQGIYNHTIDNVSLIDFDGEWVSFRDATDHVIMIVSSRWTRSVQRLKDQEEYR